MGYARDFHVERYLRECFVPRIAPVSKVCKSHTKDTMQTSKAIFVGNDHELHWGESPRTTTKLLNVHMTLPQDRARLADSLAT
jgi:hypothetical protein